MATNLKIAGNSSPSTVTADRIADDSLEAVDRQIAIEARRRRNEADELAEFGFAAPHPFALFLQMRRQDVNSNSISNGKTNNATCTRSETDSGVLQGRSVGPGEQGGDPAANRVDMSAPGLGQISVDGKTAGASGDGTHVGAAPTQGLPVGPDVHAFDQAQAANLTHTSAQGVGQASIDGQGQRAWPTGTPQLAPNELAQVQTANLARTPAQEVGQASIDGQGQRAWRQGTSQWGLNETAQVQTTNLARMPAQGGGKAQMASQTDAIPGDGFAAEQGQIEQRSENGPMPQAADVVTLSASGMNSQLVLPAQGVPVPHMHDPNTTAVDAELGAWGRATAVGQSSDGRMIVGQNGGSLHDEVTLVHAMLNHSGARMARAPLIEDRPLHKNKGDAGFDADVNGTPVTGASVGAWVQTVATPILNTAVPTERMQLVGDFLQQMTTQMAANIGATEFTVAMAHNLFSQTRIKVRSLNGSFAVDCSSDDASEADWFREHANELAARLSTTLHADVTLRVVNRNDQSV